MNTWWENFKSLTRYPSLIAGIVILLALLSLSIYAVTTMPYDEAIHLWRGGGELVEKNPRRVPPAWFDWFTADDLPRTFTVTEGGGRKREESLGDGNKQVEIVLPFEYEYDRFPSEINLFTDSTSAERIPITVRW
ncbi:MAG: ABC transporter permease, partial [Candidatus Bipolaricaulota bacterium]